MRGILTILPAAFAVAAADELPDWAGVRRRVAGNAGGFIGAGFGDNSTIGRWEQP